MADSIRLACVACCVFLCACSTGITKQSVIDRHGPPDMTCEQAGDMARFYLGSAPAVPPWQATETVYYYIEADMAFTFKGDSPKQSSYSIISFQDHLIYHQMVADNDESRSFETYSFGDDYQALWSVGDLEGEDWARGFGFVGFTLHDGKTINDLLRVIASSEFPELKVVFTDREVYGGLRMQNEFAAEYVLSVLDKSEMYFDYDPAEYRWAMALLIPVQSLSVDAIEIPAGLPVRYQSAWQDLVSFHNGREIEAGQAPEPTTCALIQRIRGGVFRGEDD